LLQQVHNLENENESLRVRLARGALEDLVSGARELAPGIKVAWGEVEAVSVDELRLHADFLRDRLGDGGVGVLAARIGDKACFVAVCGSAAVRQGIAAGELARRVSSSIDGSGGGRPDMAQAGAKDSTRIPEALAGVGQVVRELVSEGRKR
jgi:alanyl-tRNA synthetase